MNYQPFYDMNILVSDDLIVQLNYLTHYVVAGSVVLIITLLAYLLRIFK